jgi:Peptidase family M48
VNHADFVHLVRSSEYACAENSTAYRRNVALFAALGYAWVIGCLFLGVGILAWLVPKILHGQFRFNYLWVLIAASGLCWTSLRALWCKFEEPQGLHIQADDAPLLFDALTRIRSKVKGPQIDKVYLDNEFNASISQYPRWGIFGGTANYLTIGLPLLMAVDRQRVLAILAHEYGHLRGDHGRFAAWIYRTRVSWAKLHHSLQDDQGPVAAATQTFLRWYFPRFSAKTFALARQDEYEADRIAGRLLGKDVTASALTEIEIKGDWLVQKFWPNHWRTAATQALPLGPYSAMRKQLLLAPEPVFAQESLRSALKRISNLQDTHPVLRDRIESLEASKGLPVWSTKSAIDLLGSKLPQWITHFDQQWCKENATEWKLHHAYMGRVIARIDILSSRTGHHNVDELVESADLRRRLDPQAEVHDYYAQALHLAPSHAGALRGLAVCLPKSARAQRMDVINNLYDNSVAHRWWASRLAVAELETPAHDAVWDDKALKLWRDRLKQAQTAEDLAWEELTGSPFFQAIAPHDLNEFELNEVQVDLVRCKPIARAWLVRKSLKEFPYRRCYILFIDLPGLNDQDRYDLCRMMEQTLSLPGQVLTLWAGHSPTIQEITKNAFKPIYLKA